MPLYGSAVIEEVPGHEHDRERRNRKCQGEEFPARGELSARGRSRLVVEPARRTQFTHVQGPFTLARDRHACAIPGPSCQPCWSRTWTITFRMSFHVCGFIITSLGNMQPSQQRWRSRFTGWPL